MAKFRKKPVVIEAVQFDGTWESYLRVCAMGNDDDHVWLDGTFAIKTLEGNMIASAGDWIIRGVKGEIYPCKPDIFEATYEPAE